MGAYLINDVRVRSGVRDKEALRQLQRTVEAHRGRWHSQREHPADESAQGHSLVVVEFGTITAAEKWYSSSDYATVSRLLVDNAIDLLLTDDVGPDFTMAGFAAATIAGDDLPEEAGTAAFAVELALA